MDTDTLRHLDKWLAQARYPDEQSDIRAAIIRLVDVDPDLLADHSWPDLERMAEG